MILGIVGAEEAKFTTDTRFKARDLIHHLLTQDGVTGACSGECHLGGIDIWAHEIADSLKLPFIPCPPARLAWEGGYKQRNMKIARESDEVICIAVRVLPPDFDERARTQGSRAMRFESCYHHRDQVLSEIPPHVKSGGCWTTWFARTRLKKIGRLLVVD